MAALETVHTELPNFKIYSIPLQSKTTKANIKINSNGVIVNGIKMKTDY